MTVPANPSASGRKGVKLALLVLLVLAVLGLPFALFGEEAAVRILGTHERQTWTVAVLGIILLTADSLAPIPSSLVIVAVALHAGGLIGTIAGTLGLCGQVVGAAWFGRVAVGRFTARLFGLPDREQLRLALQQRLALTLGCVRSVPLLAETSVVIAASLGIPVQRICRVTALPNFAIAATYSFAAEAGVWVALAAIVASIAVSLALWRTSPFHRRA